MKPLDILKKRVQETKEKRMRAEMEIEQLNKNEASIYEEASGIAGRKLSTPEEIAEVRDEKAEETRRLMSEMAESLHAIGQLDERDVSTLREAGYLK